MVAVIYIGIIASIILVAWSFSTRPSLSLPLEIKKEITEESWYRQEKARKPLIFTRPFLPLNRFLFSKFGDHGLKDKLTFLEINLLPEDFLSTKYLIILGLILTVWVIAKQMQPLWLLGIIIAGYLFPELHLMRLMKKRKQLIIKALPDSIDILTLCVQGGLDFVVGMDWVIKRSSPNPLTKELANVLQEIRVGKPRQEALKGMARRVDIPDIFSFVNTLVHADRMGTPILDVLNALSDEARRRRFQRGERLALQAPIKMLFPLVVFILPVVGIIVGGPVLLKFLGGGLPKF